MRLQYDVGKINQIKYDLFGNMQKVYLFKGLLLLFSLVLVLNFMAYDRSITHAGSKRALTEYNSYHDDNIDINSIQKSCEAKRKIVFHKTHKCSSTTIQNILFRYTKKHSLHLALPDRGNFLGEDSGFSVNFHKDHSIFQHYFKPDIFCLHNRWNTNEVKKLYAPEIPIYFTILRDPVDVFISAWDYVEASRLFFNGQSLENFVMSDKPKPDQQIGQIHLNNSMMYDFGFTSEQSEDTSAIEQKIKEIESTFGLVMIVEHFEESIVFLKHELCWEYDDLVYLKLNAHKKGGKSTISQRAQEKLRKWLKADQMLYDHFKALFLQKLESFGKNRMRDELTKLAQSIERFKSQCSIKQGKNSNPRVRSRPRGSTPEICMDLVKHELKFIKELRATDLARISKISENKTVGIDLDAFDPEQYVI